MGDVWRNAYVNEVLNIIANFLFIFLNQSVALNLLFACCFILFDSNKKASSWRVEKTAYGFQDFIVIAGIIRHLIIAINHVDTLGLVDNLVEVKKPSAADKDFFQIFLFYLFVCLSLF